MSLNACEQVCLTYAGVTSRTKPPCSSTHVWFSSAAVKSTVQSDTDSVVDSLPVSSVTAIASPPPSNKERNAWSWNAERHSMTVSTKEKLGGKQRKYHPPIYCIINSYPPNTMPEMQTTDIPHVCYPTASAQSPLAALPTQWTATQCPQTPPVGLFNIDGAYLARRQLYFPSISLTPCRIRVQERLHTYGGTHFKKKNLRGVSYLLGSLRRRWRTTVGIAACWGLKGEGCVNNVSLWLLHGTHWGQKISNTT